MIAGRLFHSPRILFLIVVTIVVAGLSSFFVMPRLEDPVLGRRVGVVTTPWPGADAGQVESLVSVLLEQSLTSIAEIKTVKSNSRAGISNVVVELQDSVTDTDQVWAKVQTNIQQASGRLPQLAGERLQPKLDVFPLKAYAAIISLKPVSPETSPARLNRLAESFREQVVAIAGTEQADLFGGAPRSLAVELEPAVLSQMQTSVVSIADQIRQSLVQIPGGRVVSGGSELSLDTSDRSDPIAQLKQLSIRSAPGRPSVQLSDVATIGASLDEPSELALIDGEPSIVVAAMVDDRLRVDQWNERLQQVLNRFNIEHVESATAEVIFSQTDQVQSRLHGLWFNLGLATLAVALVVFLLMGSGSALIVSMSLPLSGLLVVVGLRALSIPLHQMSVTGLIVALGLLIDNAIVIVEEINKRIRDGLSIREAIADAVRHLAVPLLGSTITTALAFLPIAILPGPAGEFVGTIAVSVILAISISFVLSMTVIPALFGLIRQATGSRYSGSTDPEPPAWRSWLAHMYANTLRFAFARPWFCVVPVALIAIGGYLSFRSLPVQFFPASDRQQIQIEVEATAVASVNQVRQTVDRITQLVESEPGINRQHWFIGRSAPTFFYNVVPRRRGTPFYAQAFLDLDANVDPEALTQQLQRVLDEEVLDCRCLVRQLQQGPPFDAPVEIRINGPNLEVLRYVGSELRQLISEVPGVLHTRSDLEDGRTGLQLDFDARLAAQSGISRAQVAQTLYTSIEGASAGSVFIDGESVPIKVRLDLPKDAPLDSLRTLPLPTRPTGPPTQSRGRPQQPPARPVATTISHVADFRWKADPGGVIRINGQRTNEVKAYIEAGVLPAEIIDKIRRSIRSSGFRVPEGYSIQFGGEDEQRTQAVQQLISNAIVLFALMLLTLVASFRSFRCAAIVAIVGALAACMSPIAIHAFGYPFGFMAIIGTMGLVGVAINDSIVVLAAIRSNPHARLGDVDEIANAVNDCTTHIIATTLTTVLGFTPLVLSSGRFWPPLAVAIAGGVGGATFLALWCVPAIYRIVCGRTAAKHHGGEPLSH